MAETLKSVYVAVESLRNAYDEIVRHLPGWLSVSLEFRSDNHDQDDVQRFWVSLGVESDVAETLAEMNLEWSQGKLWLSDTYMGKPELFEELTGVMLYLFRFRRFTESRWTTIGSSMRTLTLAQCAGLSGLVKHLRADPKTSEYYIHGWDRLDDS